MCGDAVPSTEPVRLARDGRQDRAAGRRGPDRPGRGVLRALPSTASMAWRETWASCCRPQPSGKSCGPWPRTCPRSSTRWSATVRCCTTSIPRSRSSTYGPGQTSRPRRSTSRRASLPAPGGCTPRAWCRWGAGHLVALFFSGHRHAGENLADLLRHHADSLA